MIVIESVSDFPMQLRGALPSSWTISTDVRPFVFHSQDLTQMVCFTTISKSGSSLTYSSPFRTNTFSDLADGSVVSISESGFAMVVPPSSGSGLATESTSLLIKTNTSALVTQLESGGVTESYLKKISLAARLGFGFEVMFFGGFLMIAYRLGRMR